MILYHGSNLKIDAIDLSKCKPYKEFWARLLLYNNKKTSRIYGW